MDKIITLQNLKIFWDNIQQKISQIISVQIYNQTIDLIYPIGSVYISTNNSNPSIFFGGEWEQIKDRFLLSAGDTYMGGGDWW